MMNDKMETDSSLKLEDKPVLAPTIHDFDIIKPISRGAFGKVFLCHRKDVPDKKLAVKVMKKSEVVQKNMVDQVIAERNALAITKSPFVVGLLYCLQTVNNVFLVMEYMIGGDLKSLLSMYGYLEEDHAIFYFAECVLALKYLHRRGIVHRDIKPDNMLLSHTGHLKLTDFGLSSTGMKDKELQVADFVSKTPFPAGSKAHRERLIRTPGQILSLTSHLSFSNVTGDLTGESLGGSYTCDVSEYGRQSRASLASDPGNSQLDSPDIRVASSLSFCNITTPTSTDKLPAVVTQSCPMVTPVQTSKVRLVRKNSFSEAMAKHVAREKELGLSRAVLDRKPTTEKSPSPELMNSSALQPLPSTSFDLGHPDKTMEFAINMSSENIKYDEVFQEDKENICVPSSPLNYLPSSPFTARNMSIDCSVSSPPYRPSPPQAEDFGEESRGSVSSSPKHYNSQQPPDSLNINISPLKHSPCGEGRDEEDTPNITPSSRSYNLTAQENMRALRDLERTLSPETLRGDKSDRSWDSDIILDTGSFAVRRAESDHSQSLASQVNVSRDSNEETSVASPPLQVELQQADNCQTPMHFTLPGGGGSLKRKCSASPTRTNLTSDLTELVLIKKARLETPKAQLGSSSSSSSEEETREGYGFSTPVQKCSSPLSAVPHHMQQWKGLKAVKFVSPAGLTPVQPPPSVLPQPQLSLPFSLAELDTSHCQQPSSTPVSQTPTRLTPLRTPKSVSRPGREREQSRILGTPDYLAPELLLAQGHGAAVDWWALGVCLYEFMTGIPPFNDDSPSLVFDNILSLNIEWPEGEEALSPNAVDCILSLLCLDPSKRADDVAIQTRIALTSDVLWNEILEQEPPFVPNPDSDTDTTYFNAKNNVQNVQVSSVDIDHI